ncbi:MAG: Crp/Fnr family transcriptional regulator [Epsilonproteobacteria bacterium]|nr:Crp/Fnr family transcriptional regulator [Campylobacterota bacterium]
MEYFKAELAKQINMSEEEWSYIASKFTPRSAKKGEIIHHAGEIFSQVWYIQSGVARSYFIDNRGKDVTWQLYFRDESPHKLNLFMDDSVSYYEQSGSMLSFEILEDAQFYVISLSDLEQIYDIDKKWQQLGRIMVHDIWYASTYKRVLSLMGERVQERYERLLNEHPSIFEKVKAYHVASYLGIAPQTLSKLRKNESR